MNIYVDACAKGVGIVVGTGETDLGVPLVDAEEIYYPITSPMTTNQGEYLAIMLGLFICGSRGITSVTMYSDIELAVNQINGRYRAKASTVRSLSMMARGMLKVLNIELKHIKGKDNPADEVSRR